jgi:hypothetical protein
VHELGNVSGEICRAFTLKLGFPLVFPMLFLVILAVGLGSGPARAFGGAAAVCGIFVGATA